MKIGYIYLEIDDSLEELVVRLRKYFSIGNAKARDGKNKRYHYDLCSRENDGYKTIGTGLFDSLEVFYDEEEKRECLEIQLDNWRVFDYEIKEIKEVQIINERLKIFI